MNKKVTFPTKPPANGVPPSPDAWVQARQVTPAEPTKRLTLDIPLRLHAQFKSQCALRGISMADEVQRLIEQALAPQG